VTTLAQDRYGRRNSPRRRPLIIVGVIVAVALGLGFIGWVTILERPHVTYEDYGYNVVSDAQTRVTFDVGFHGGTKAATCTVHALNELGTEVGLENVLITAAAHGTVRTTVTLSTSERATTGVVEACSKA
jgi:hypothetical protein